MKTRILQIGAGSMGTRRLRDLSLREDIELSVFDIREDRRMRAFAKHGVKTFENISDALEWRPDAMIISTPPDIHKLYVDLALEKGYSHFCEADIWTADSDRIIKESQEKKLLSAPSFTSLFLPITKELKLISDRELGRLYSYQFRLCFYLPAWHPWEGDEYYANHRSTSGGREAVPFEISLLTYIFGGPSEANGVVSQRGLLSMDSEDVWSIQVRLENGGTGQVTVVMSSPYTERKGWFAGTNGFVDFDIISGTIHKRFPVSNLDEVIETGSLKNVLEKAYSDEINMFADALQGKTAWPFSYHDSAISTSVLAAAEKSAMTAKTESVRTDLQPAVYPDGYK